MRRLTPFVVLVTLFVLMVPLHVAAQPPVTVPGPSTRHAQRSEGVPITGDYEIVNFVVDIAPGAWTPEHHHGGQLQNLVLEGEVTFRHGGTETVYTAGQSFVEEPGVVGQVGNAGTAPAVVFATALLPVGVALTTVSGVGVDNPPPGPVLRWMYRTPGWAQTGPFELVQVVLDFAPGSWTPPHSHGGVLPFTTLQGELTFRMRGHHERIMRPGDSDTELPGHIAMAGNDTNQLVTTVLSIVLPKGNQITYVVPSFDECSWFPETKQSLCFGFRAYWEQYGGLAIFGYPISAEMQDATGVTVQWFERARFEWRPGTWPERYDVHLGRIGSELADAVGIDLTAR